MEAVSSRQQSIHSESEGTIAFSSPSNIALVKYWGKYGNQLPLNPSVSFTLEHARTEMKLTYSPKPSAEHSTIDLSFRFEGKENHAFAKKIHVFLTSLLPEMPFLAEFTLAIDSSNSFPHSVGIASSASSMSALGCCLAAMENRLRPGWCPDFTQRASFLSRLGSGSACRSLFPLCASWGKSASLSGSSDTTASPLEDSLHPLFHSYHDAILLVSQKEKEVSSRAGHGLMINHPYAPIRYEQANQHFSRMLQILQAGDLDAFADLTESEAMTLHALMMASSPYFILLEPQTLSIIRKVRGFRKDSGIPLCFTLDAGPNVHLLYPTSAKTAVNAFICSDLAPFCANGQWIADKVGRGPRHLSP